MRYTETVEANIWDSDNEAQVDKIVEWLTLSVPGQFSYDTEDNELRVQTEVHTAHTVRDGQAIIISRKGIEVMNGRAFTTIYELMQDL
jgi:hypothetical protein